MARQKVRRTRQKQQTAATQQVTLQQVIDRYVTLATQKKELENKLNKTKEIILKHLGEGVHEGNEHAIQIVKVMRKTLAPELVKNYLDENTFYRVASVSVSAVSKILTPEELEDCVAETTETTQIRIKR